MFFNNWTKFVKIHFSLISKSENSFSNILMTWLTGKNLSRVRRFGYTENEDTCEPKDAFDEPTFIESYTQSQISREEEWCEYPNWKVFLLIKNLSKSQLGISLKFPAQFQEHIVIEPQRAYSQYSPSFFLIY